MNIIKLLSKKYNFDEEEAKKYIDDVKRMELKKMQENEEKELKEKYKNFAKEKHKCGFTCDLEENDLSHTFFSDKEIKIMPSYKMWRANEKSGRREFWHKN